MSSNPPTTRGQQRTFTTIVEKSGSPGILCVDEDWGTSIFKLTAFLWSEFQIFAHLYSKLGSCTAGTITSRKFNKFSLFLISSLLVLRCRLYRSYIHAVDRVVKIILPVLCPESTPELYSGRLKLPTLPGAQLKLLEFTLLAFVHLPLYPNLSATT
mgnify:CR=1 FL=1